MASSLEPLLAQVVRDYRIAAPKYALVGENFGAATYWARQHDLPLRDYGIITGPQALCGLAPPWEVVITGWPHTGELYAQLLAELRFLEGSGVRVHWNGDIDT